MRTVLGWCIDASNQRIRELKGLVAFEQGENSHPKRCSVPSYHADDHIKGSADIGKQQYVSGLEVDVLKAQLLVDLCLNISRSVRLKFVSHVHPVELAQVEPN